MATLRERRAATGLFSISLFVSTVIKFFFGILEALLVLRLLLRFFGANAANGFVSWVYATTQPIVAPFQGIFANPVLSGAFVIEFATLLAILVYGIIAYLVSELIDYLVYQSDAYRHERYAEHDHYDDRY
jgi:uncharacterized PurR-regulated membrane protein YhhQ (DUF165 family)